MANNEQLTHTDQSDVIMKIGESLYLSEDMADFHFKFEVADHQYESVPAHKILLMAASDVFRTMFNGSWVEKDEVEIVDASIDEFKEFLQFIYLKAVTISMENIAKVMYLGDKYNIPKCLSVCEKFIINTLKEENVCWAYELAIVYNQANLKQYCETFIGINTKAVLVSDNFLGCDSKVLAHILKLDVLSCPENAVFEACMNWVKAAAKATNLTRENVQEKLGELFYEIRFKSMTPFEFINLIPKYGYLLSTDEYTDISQSIGVQEFQPNIFSKYIRTPFENIQCNESTSIFCSRLLSLTYSTMPYYLKDIEKTTFSTNTPLLLKTFNCCEILEFKNNGYYFLDDLASQITIVQIQIATNPDEEIVLHTENILLQSKNVTCVTLSTPLLIRLGFMYEIRLKQETSVRYCTGSLFKSNVEMESNIIVQFHDDTTVDGDEVARGLIRYFKFYRIYE